MRRCIPRHLLRHLRNTDWNERGREMFYLTTHSTHFIYGYMASDIWLRTILIVRKETRCRHIGYSYRLTARVLLYAPSHRQDNTYDGLCYTSRGALAGSRTDWNEILCPPNGTDPSTHCTMSERSTSVTVMDTAVRGIGSFCRVSFRNLVSTVQFGPRKTRGI